MRLQPKIFLAALLVLALATSTALAAKKGKGIPGPIAGASIGYVALAGGYYLYRRWRKQNKE
jgi:hypothetical protein